MVELLPFVGGQIQKLSASSMPRQKCALTLREHYKTVCLQVFKGGDVVWVRSDTRGAWKRGEVAREDESKAKAKKSEGVQGEQKVKDSKESKESKGSKSKVKPKQGEQKMKVIIAGSATSWKHMMAPVFLTLVCIATS